MITLIDGLCQGTYMCKRAPLFLRAVKGKDNAGNTDVLDLVDDTPTTGESVYIYKLEGLAGTVHLHMKKGSGWYAFATYRYLPNVDGEALRDNEAWQDWATARAKNEPKETV